VPSVNEARVRIAVDSVYIVQGYFVVCAPLSTMMRNMKDVIALDVLHSRICTMQHIIYKRQLHNLKLFVMHMIAILYIYTLYIM